MTIKDYVPVYDNTETEALLKGDDQNINRQTSVGINANLCLTEESANELAKVLARYGHPVVVMKAPIFQAKASPEKFDHFVPWLHFFAWDGADSKGNSVSWPDGTTRDAAVLARHWQDPAGNPPPGENQLPLLDYVLAEIAVPIGSAGEDV